MSTDTQKRHDGCDGTTPVGCGDEATDHGLCEWHRRDEQRIELGLEMLEEAQRQLERIDRGELAADRGLCLRTLDRFGDALELAVSWLPGEGGRAVAQRRRVLAAVMKTTEMKRLVRSQPRGSGELPRWLMPDVGPLRKLALLAVVVAMAAWDLPERPLRPQQVVDAICEQLRIRDPATANWCETAMLDRMVAEINAVQTAEV